MERLPAPAFVGVVNSGRTDKRKGPEMTRKKWEWRGEPTRLTQKLVCAFQTLFKKFEIFSSKALDKILQSMY